MGESLYSWHAFGLDEGSPTGPLVRAEGHASDTLLGRDMFRFWISYQGYPRRRKRVRRFIGRRATAFAVIHVDLTIGVWYQPFRGYYPLATYQGRGGLNAPFVQWSAPEWTVKRRSPNPTASKEGPMHLAPVETQVFSKLMNIVAHCCETRYDDGEPRRPGWFTIKTLGAAWCVAVKDPDSCCQMTTTAATLDDALALADVLLGSDEAPWEPDPFLKRSETKKKN